MGLRRLPLTGYLLGKGNTLYWRLRYWWYDTEGGAHARAAAFVLSCLVLVGQTVRLMLAAWLPVASPAEHGQQAVYWWVVQLILLVVSALVMYALRPKIEQQKPQESNPPSTEDGQAVVDILGTGWIEDYFVLAWKPNGVQKIKAKGKK